MTQNDFNIKIISFVLVYKNDQGIVHYSQYLSGSDLALPPKWNVERPIVKELRFLCRPAPDKPHEPVIAIMDRHNPLIGRKIVFVNWTLKYELAPLENDGVWSEKYKDMIPLFGDKYIVQKAEIMREHANSILHDNSTNIFKKHAHRFNSYLESDTKAPNHTYVMVEFVGRHDPDCTYNVLIAVNQDHNKKFVDNIPIITEQTLASPL